MLGGAVAERSKALLVTQNKGKSHDPMFSPTPGLGNLRKKYYKLALGVTQSKRTIWQTMLSQSKVS